MKHLPLFGVVFLLLMQSCTKNTFVEPVSESITVSNNLVTATTWPVSNEQELKNAIKSALPGDIIVMNNGTWRNIVIRLNTSGTDGNPITLTAETAGKVIIGDNSSIAFQGSYLTVSDLKFKDGKQGAEPAIVFGSGSSNCRLTNTAIVNYNNLNKSTKSRWVQVEGYHNTIDHCYFSDKTGLGPLMNIAIGLTSQPADHHVIVYNYFGHRRPGAKGNGYEIIRMGTGDEADPYNKKPTYDTIRDNYFTECNGEEEIVSSKSSNNYFIHNTFINSKGSLSIRQADNCRVEKNFFLGNAGNGTGGVRIYGTGHSIVNNCFFELGGKKNLGAITLMKGDRAVKTFPPVSDVLIDSNLFYQNTRFIMNNIAFGSRSDFPKDVVFTANIFFKSQHVLINEVVAENNYQWNNNFYYNVSLPYDYSSTGLINTDPVLVLQNSIPRISASSPDSVKSLDVSSDLIYSQSSVINPIKANEVGVSFVP